MNIEQSTDEAPPQTTSYLVELGRPVHIPWPGTWRVERTPSGGHLVTELSPEEGQAEVQNQD